MNITTQVENFIQKKPRGEPFTSSSIIKFGTRAAVDQVLSRLTKACASGETGIKSKNI